uniref:hypothetical protein n=1 Tax=Prevotella sp. TaxID=59823 RepID=UPI004024FD3E
MRKQQIVNAIMDKDLKQILIQTGQYEDFINGNLKCACCGNKISIDNISTLVPYNTENGIKLKFYCNRIDCVNSEK